MMTSMMEHFPINREIANSGISATLEMLTKESFRKPMFFPSRDKWVIHFPANRFDLSVLVICAIR